MIDDRPFTGVYTELLQQTNLEQIRDLLRIAQDHSEEAKKDINLSNIKKDAINYLRRAVSKGYLTDQQVYQLLRETEESGQQHIYLYRPKNADVTQRLNDYGVVPTRLFDEAWGRDFFPIYSRVDTETRWVDFRNLDGGGWLLKAYGHETITRTIGSNRIQLDENTIRLTRDVKTEDINTVSVVRWRPPDVLEVRIDRAAAGKTTQIIPDRLDKITNLLRPAVNLDTEMVDYSLQIAISNMLAERNSQNAENPRFRVGYLAVLDKKEGRIEFTPFDDGDLDDDDGRSETVQTSLDNGGVPLAISIKWLEGDDTHDSMPPILPTKIQGRSINVVNIARRVSPQVLDYVINQLRTNS